MSAKYQDLYVKVSGYKDSFQRLGYIEEAINEALDNRGFEKCEAEYTDEIGSFKIEFK